MSGKTNSLQIKDLTISGLDCADCAAKLEKKIQSLNGVATAKLNFATAKLHLECDTDISKVEQTIFESGYGILNINSKEDGNYEVKNQWFKDLKVILTFNSGLFLLIGIISEYLQWPQLISIFPFVISMISGGYYIARSGIYSIKSLSLDMNLLMTISAIGAAIIGEWSEGASVVFLFSLGNLLQNFTMDKARNSIRSLIELAPKEAYVLKDGREVIMQVDEIKIGDIVIIKPGDKITVDGRVVKGSSSVNQAPITGESIPVNKNVDDVVYAGTINNEGALEIEVTKLVNDTTLAKIIHLVEEAQEQKAPSQQFVEVFSKYYTPIVIIGAIMIAVIPTLLFSLPFLPWFKKSLILLVISCPCALVISTPVSIIAAIGNAAKKGVLIKGGAYLENTGKVKAIAFDKTGTLTKGQPEIIDILPLGHLNKTDIMIITGALEKNSQHPIGKAITNWLKNYKLEVPKIDDFTSIPGQGVTAVVEGRKYYLGNLKLFYNLGFHIPEELSREVIEFEKEGKTVIILGKTGSLLAIITLADVIRETSINVIYDLRKEGISNFVILTGDNKGSAQFISERIGIDEFHANLLPEDKLTVIDQLIDKYGTVAMVGDGVNDAPALVKADIGIAMGGAGTDTALESADLVLMSDDLTKLPFAVRLSRKSLRIIKENIIFSIIIKAVFLILTFMGMANLWMAVFADTGAALIVIINGMRLLRTN